MKIYLKILGFTMLILFLVSCGSGTSASVETPTKKYAIGHDWIALEDTNRDNTPVTAQLYYPAKTDGEQTAVVNEKFPLVLFAHGYSQLYSDYQYIWERLVKEGYIVVFITTQDGVTIDIDEYADDISFLLQELKDADATFESVIKGHIAQKTALMGHSTGGGAIFIAQAKKPQATTIVSLASLGALYGTISGSSPIDAAKNIKIPSLILSGEKDCITPADTNQKPLYNNIDGEKTIVTIKGGDHCGFTNTNTKCLVAESVLCGIFFQGTTIDENLQREVSSELIVAWVDYYLKEKNDSKTSFKTLLDSGYISYITNGHILD